VSALVGNRVVLRPIVEADAPALREMRAAPEVEVWWGVADERWPLDDDPSTTPLAVENEGEVAGYIKFTEENDPDYRHAGIDLFLGPRHLGRGLGTDALRTLIRHLVEDRGHHRLTIDPAVDNEAAIRCYEKVGFCRVGVMHAYWRDHRTGDWRDALLMELVEEPRPARG
jgi:aminoglycoside 6'-N-acetyltransferase